MPGRRPSTAPQARPLKARGEGASPAPAGAAARQERRRNENRGLLVALSLLIALTFFVGRAGYYRSGDDVGYDLGLVGGVMMLLLLAYPLRKHLPAMRAFGPTRLWFAGHMILGIAGPLLVLAHTTWHVGSTNALVALVSMLLVAGSGVIGRFVYVRIHHGLYGQKTTLRELQQQVGFGSEEVHSNLSFAPMIEARIREFEATAMPEFKSLTHDAWRFMTLGLRRQWTLLRCRREVRGAMRRRGRARGWDDAKLRRRCGQLDQLVADYLGVVQRVSQFAVYEKIFSLWHVLHVPLVYLLVLSAIAHVVAVHLY
ncbi:MAG TPA: hypothetical protein VMU33_20660 [Burkholderiaceae bacterium]|nr:hypothetical protein [Burkholderiaceae bacterium]